MTEQAIIRTQVIVVNEIGTNTYGDLTFTDKAGRSYKVGAKRKTYFEKVITPGVGVQLNYAMSSFGKEYIYSATSVKEGLPSPTTPQPMTHPNAPVIPDRPNKILSKEELGVMGKQDWEEKDRITRKSIERQTALNAAIELAKILWLPPLKSDNTSDKIIATAKRFEAYLEYGDVKEVQQAKTIGEEPTRGE